MIKISLKGLAKFMTATAAGQRKVLRNYKYPDPEGFAQARYYRESRERITAYHKNGHDERWLLSYASRLDTLAATATEGRRTKYRSNARALRGYAKYFGHKDFKILTNLSFDLEFGEVLVSVVPDLHVEAKGREKIIKLKFPKNKQDDKMIRIMTQAMFEAQSKVGMGLPSSGVLCFDVPQGKVHKGARVGSRTRNEIEAACANIAAIWDPL